MEYCKFPPRPGISVQKDEAPARRAGGGMDMLAANRAAGSRKVLRVPWDFFQPCPMGRADGGAGRRAC